MAWKAREGALSSVQLPNWRTLDGEVALTKHSGATAYYAVQIAKCFNASLYVACVCSQHFVSIRKRGHLAESID